jgi:curved DNA-binding protein
MTTVGSGDPYAALGVGRDASEEDIRRAYRRLARQYHPDINKEPGAEDRFKEVSQAYDVLRDPEKRAAYDRPQRGRPGDGGGFRDVRVDFGDGDFGGGEFAGGDVDELFESLFGGRRAGRGRTAERPARGADHEAVLELSLEEAARGGRRRVTLADGRSYEVNIPAGVRDGQRIRLAGEGDRGAASGPAGDLFLRVHLRPHPRFRVEGRDLRTDLPVAPWEAALGAEVEVPTLTGRTRVTVPPGSSTGRTLRLRGEGMAGGDLYADVKIMVPPRLTAQERELFERLAEVSSFDPRRGR